MLPETKATTFLNLIATASNDELIWMNGYLNGLVSKNKQTTEPVKNAIEKLTILYGTETGNSKKLATDFAQKIKTKGIVPKVVGMDQYRLTDLPKEAYLLAVISTQGEGDPPDAAKKFYDHIHNNGFKLTNLNYSVLALGDTSYPLYCKAGEDVDLQLEKLGGKRIAPIQKCDVDYDEDANNWIEKVLNNLQNTATAVAIKPTETTAIAAKTVGKKIYTGTVVTNINLNDRGSNKQTHHVEILADDIEYQCGDSIGIVPKNIKEIVDEIIWITGIDKNKKITFKKEESTVLELLQNKLSITYLTARIVGEYAKIVAQTIPEVRMNLVDLLKVYPVKNAAQFEEVIQILNGISPRLYTISSAPAATGNGEVHITVAQDKYTINNTTQLGLCSNYINAFKIDETVQFFVQKNKHFKLPAADKDIIMIGPGTGIAGFRSFLAERDAAGARGRNWLFFGEQQFATDFLYQTEIQNWFATGVLNKISLAFSRDQKEKIYVQHKMIEQGASFFEWINNGASVYICGKKDPMSVDVETAILNIIKVHGNYDNEGAKKYLDNMKEQHRYEKDVY
jgi:sulfite reductase (NADPH) flavoprotein alpha-component